MLDVKEFGRFLSECGFRDFSGVPCSYLAPLINYAINENRFVMAANEGEAVAIASGISLVNSSLGNHSVDCGNLGVVITDEVTPTPKFPQSSQSNTANTRILESSGGESQAVIESSSLDSQVYLESTTKDSQNLHTPQAAVSCDDFKGCQARGEGVTSSVMTEAKCVDSLKSAQETTPKKSYGVVLMQNSGLSNALSPLTSLNHTFGIPILGFVSLRGERDESGRNTDEPQHELLGVITDKLLAVCEIEYAFLSADFKEAKAQVLKAREVLESNKSFFFIVRDKTFAKEPLVRNPLKKLEHSVLSEKSGEESHRENENLKSEQIQNLDSTKNRESNPINNARNLDCHDLPHKSRNDNELDSQHNTESKHIDSEISTPTRLSALSVIQHLATESASVLLATTGKCGRELYELGDRDNQLYMVGSMGCVSSLGLGIALKSKKKVIAIDGDSALLMRLGSLSTNAYYAKVRDRGNFCHILLDNQSHDSTGGQFNLSPFMDFCAVARACGYEHIYYAQDLAEFEEVLRAFVECESGGAWFVYLRIAKGSKEPLGRPKITPKEVAMRLSSFLNSTQED